jgi:hypothetical protein
MFCPSKAGTEAAAKALTEMIPQLRSVWPSPAGKPVGRITNPKVLVQESVWPPHRHDNAGR